jgi:hypothetical protein
MALILVMGCLAPDRSWIGWWQRIGAGVNFFRINFHDTEKYSSPYKISDL